MLKVRHLTESLERKLNENMYDRYWTDDCEYDDGKWKIVITHSYGDSLDRDLYLNGEKVGEVWDDGTIELSTPLSSVDRSELEEIGDGQFYINESLNEARNPENEEINALLRQYVAKKNIPNKARKAIEAAGIKIDGEGESIYFTGPNGKVLSGEKRTFRYGPKAPDTQHARAFKRQGENAGWDLGVKKDRWGYTTENPDAKSWEAADLKGYLDSDRPMKMDWNDRYEMNHPGEIVTGSTYNPEDRTDQGRSLQPYSGPYRQYKKKRDEAERDAKRHASRDSWIGQDLLTDEEIEAEVDKLRQKLIRDREMAQNIINNENKDYAKADAAMKDIAAKAKAKRQG